ncbi:MAG: hypothetical protein VB102_12190 [Paludibacter sp.]|nr:hypothetical protein [Paludibacter sp.]
MRLRLIVLFSALFLSFANVQAQLFYSLIGQTEAKVKTYLREKNPNVEISEKEYPKCTSLGQMDKGGSYYLYLFLKSNGLCEEIDIMTDEIGLLTYVSLFKMYEDKGQAERVGPDTWVFYHKGNKLTAYYEEMRDEDGVYYSFTVKK